MKYEDMRVGSLVHFINSLMDANIVENANIVFKLERDLGITLEKKVIAGWEFEAALNRIRLSKDFSTKDVNALDLFVDGYFGSANSGDISIG